MVYSVLDNLILILTNLKSAQWPTFFTLLHETTPPHLVAFSGCPSRTIINAGRPIACFDSEDAKVERSISAREGFPGN
jgi:hypothetical protein